MNKLKNMKIFCYIITFEEEGSKDLKINDVKRKDNFTFGIFSYWDTLLEFLILYNKNLSISGNIITVTFEWVQKDLVISCFSFKRELRKKIFHFERVFLLNNVWF